MTRYTRSNLEGIVSQLDIEAKQAGLIPMDSKMVYHPGNLSNGISAYLSCFRQHEDGQYENVQISFAPEFGYKVGPTEQYKRLSAALNVFYALRRKQEDAEREENRRKMNYLSEHVARRSE